MIEFFCPPLKFKLIFFILKPLVATFCFSLASFLLDLVFSPWCGIGAMVVTQEVEN